MSTNENSDSDDENGPFSFQKADESYQHYPFSPHRESLQNPLSSRNYTKKMKYSWSTPDLSTLNLNKLSPTKHIRQSYQPYQDMLRDVIKADIPILPKPRYAKLCPHKHHCIQNAVGKGLFRTFSAAFIFKTSLSFFTKLIRGKISFSTLRQIYLNEDSILFAMFVGLMSFTYKVILCALRHIRKKDPIYHKSIAAFFASFWMIIDDKTRRKQIALYCCVRAVSDVIKLLVEYKKVPIIPHTDIALFTLSQMPIMHALCHQTDALDQKYYQWIKHMGNLTEPQCQLSFRSRINPKLGYRLPSEKWSPCYPILHSDHSCLRHNTKDWFYGFVRAARIYFPVHFLPTLLFEPKRIFQDPQSYIQRKSFNVFISSIFLTTYQFNMKQCLCTLRNLSKSDETWHGVAGGLFAGMALFIENKHRRPELMLYCMPRALEVVFRLIPKTGSFEHLYYGLRSIYSPVLAFQVAMAMWMTVIHIPKGVETSNTINMTVLRVIFGSKH